MKYEDLNCAIEKLLSFSINTDLTSTISKIENDLSNQNSNFVNTYLSENELDTGILQSAFLLKNSLGQINVIIHALGIVNLLKYILEDNEVIQELSIGAGNTNRPFDLTTNKRIAEFKFINWSGERDTIRQNSVFKDFFELAEYKTDRKKYLYVLDRDVVVKFFNNNRALDSVLSKNETTRKKFYNIYGDIYSTVADYYKENNNKVEIVEIRDFDKELFKSVSIYKEKAKENVICEEKKERPQKDIISEFIIDLINDAKINGATYIDIKAGEVGKSTGFKKSFPNICRIMKKIKQEEDIILSDTPSGMGSSVTIRYFIK